jgi:predicted ThiF/HesA family dinucleotide-utilizing enzyme
MGDATRVWLARGGITIPIFWGIIHAFTVKSGRVTSSTEGINHVGCESVDRFVVDIVGEGDEAVA